MPAQIPQTHTSVASGPVVMTCCRNPLAAPPGGALTRAEAREQRPHVHPGTPQRFSQWRGQQTHRQRHQIKRDQVFGVEAEPGDGAERQPPAFIACLLQPHQHPAEPKPGERLKQVGREHHALEQENRSPQHAQARQPLREPAAADHARELASQRHGHRHDERREQPKSPEEIAENSVRPGRKQGHDRRLIHIAPIGPAAADDEVEFVAKEAVMPVGEPVQHQAGQSQQQRRSRPTRSVFRHQGRIRHSPLPGWRSVYRIRRSNWPASRPASRKNFRLISRALNPSSNAAMVPLTGLSR